MQAVVEYSNGYFLAFPKYGNAPMLFLEWLSEFRAGKTNVHKVIQSDLDDRFIVKLNMNEKQYRLAAKYINDNL